jgi:hypothetical protein
MTALRYTREEDQLAGKGGEQTECGVDASPLVGAWLNTDRATPGIIKLVLSNQEGTFIVQGFGACSPSPCDWGEVKGVVYSSGVNSQEGMAFTAFYDFGFMETSLAVYLKSGILVLDSFNTFKDRSGRSNYFSREFFYQQ